MTTTNGGGDPAPATGEMPSLSILVQYSKDFSFENPNAPQSLMQQQQQPQIGIQINVNPRQMSNTDFEVELKLEGKAEHSGNVLFAFDLNYAGVFRVENFPAEQVQPVVMIEGPRILFQFARQIVADAVRGGSYPPLFIDPIDFQALYLQRLAAAGGQLQQQTA